MQWGQQPGLHPLNGAWVFKAWDGVNHTQRMEFLLLAVLWLIPKTSMLSWPLCCALQDQPFAHWEDRHPALAMMLAQGLATAPPLKGLSFIRLLEIKTGSQATEAANLASARTEDEGGVPATSC